MVKAHSLLYAIYICLIVSILCGALLYFANLYGQLNLHFNLQEEMYIHNQSLVNFALGNKMQHEEYPVDEKLGIEGNYQVKQFGLLTMLIAKSSSKNDTITSGHFVGYYNSEKSAIHLANFSKPLSFFGKVTVIGDNQLPSFSIVPVYITNKHNILDSKGSNTLSKIHLPVIKRDVKKIITTLITEATILSNVDKPEDSLFFNSFFKETKEINIGNTISNVIFKGNFVLRSTDSLYIRKTAVLEDIILIAPKITFEEGFTGTLQAFATEKIEVGQKVILKYPSVICLFNDSSNESRIAVKKESRISGAVVLCGNPLENLNKNVIDIEEGGLILGDIYCSGTLCLKSNVYGSVYTNRFFYKTNSSIYDNVIADIEINPGKRPAYFIEIPLFDSKIKHYGILKKVL